MAIATTPIGTLPTVIFQRLDVRSGQPTTTHAIVCGSAAEAIAEGQRIELQSHLRLLAVTDAVVRPAALGR